MIGRSLARYRILSRLGRGGMGEVWVAEDTRLHRRVALKTLSPETAADPERRARLEREAQALAALNHPNIVTIYSVEEAEGTSFLTMELVEGRTLTETIPAAGLDADRLLELAIPIADALAAAHAHGITHRDLKPDNIVLGDDGRVRVLDFGLAKVSAIGPVDDQTETLAREAVLTREGSLLGTVAYMSPEQAQGLPVDRRSDVFSLGVILYEMACGHRPFAGQNSASILSSILRDPPRPLSDVDPAVPPELARVVQRCLEKQPDRRFPSAAEVRDELVALRSARSGGASAPAGVRPATAPRLRWPARLALAGLGALLLVALATFWLHRSSRQRWARQEALPELERIVDRIQFLQEGPDSWAAFELAARIGKVLPDDPLLARLRPKFSRAVTIASDPPGAAVFACYYGDPKEKWRPFGRTPLEKVPYPLGFTRVRLELAGRRPVQDLIWNFGEPTWRYELPEKGRLPDDMERVPESEAAPHGLGEALFLPGLDNLKPESTGAFLIDRFEVTNRQYREFVRAGGYKTKEYWKHHFVDGSREFSWDEAMARFSDRTGRPGPASWEVGDFPAGAADLPVGGVSWYEAAAYAAWAGKALPTIFHWNRVAFTRGSGEIVPLANMSGEGPVAVGSTRSMNRWGVYDLAGNAREWVWNASDRSGSRFILGGGWSDPRYAFADAYAQPAFDRSPINGFRCIRALGAEKNEAALERVIARPSRNFLAETPVSDAVFALYRRQFDYDATPLGAVVEGEEKIADGVRQRITFAAAYGGQRMAAYLFLPATSTPPYQVVVLFPGSGAIQRRSSKDLGLDRADFILRSSRAVLYPIYEGTYERGGRLTSDYPEPTTAYKDHLVMWGKDLRRSIDYVETRRDLDAARIAYFGLSWGGALGAILPAIEPRIHAVVLYVAGLEFQRALPEADQINYVTRVRQPTLMLNGQFDFFFPVETSQRPMFERLGTPREQKRWVVYPGGHSAPRTEMIREVLAWLDRYLGPVR